jgi:VanZ family protein
MTARAGGGTARPRRPHALARLVRSPALWRLAYVGAVVLATVSQVDLPITAAALRERILGALPSSPSGRDVIDAARNVVLFIGWGVVWVITAPRGRGRILLAQATATGLALSATVEAIQLFAPSRFPSAFDLLTNATGAFGGALAAATVWRALRAMRGRPTFFGAPLFPFAACYAAAVLLESFSPLFREARHPDAYGHPFDRFRIAVSSFEPVTFAALPLIDLVLFAPAGVLAVLALVELRWERRRAVVTVALVGAAACALAELARGFIGYVLSPGAVLLHAIAITAGALIGQAAVPFIARRRGAARRLRLLIAGYAAVLLLWSGRPFLPERSAGDVADKVSVERLIPLRAYRVQYDLHTAADALIPALLFLPVGVLLATRPLAARGVLRGIVPAALFATAIEVMQIGIRGRTFDVTDILIPLAALGSGWILARRAGYAPEGSDLRRTSSFSR